MVTLVGSTMVGSAQFKNMESCMFAREAVQSQDSVTASCVYRYKKPRDQKGEKIFGAMLEAMKAMSASTCGTIEDSEGPIR
tara:strand:- start:674 stop:916 length:243 start_codon:yes stop_codon:yes gene_type:complete